MAWWGWVLLGWPPLAVAAGIVLSKAIRAADLREARDRPACARRPSGVHAVEPGRLRQ